MFRPVGYGLSCSLLIGCGVGLYGSELRWLYLVGVLSLLVSKASVVVSLVGAWVANMFI
jgi:hypothetical protein